MHIIRIIMALAILGLGVYVAMSPELVYAPTPRAVLFLLVAILPAILLAAEATAEFKMRLPGFVATGGGSFAVMIIVLFLLAYFTNLCGAMTNYSSGPIVIYFGLGYVPAGRWLRVGFLVSLLHLTVWLGPGLLWWKWLGWW